MADPKKHQEMKDRQKRRREEMVGDPVKLEKLRADRRAWRASDLGRVAVYVHNAKKRRYEWEITAEHAVFLMRGVCHYCGVPPDPRNGIDRKDNSQGYRPENCVSCCVVCNYAKSSMSYADFLAWMDRVAKFRGQ